MVRPFHGMEVHLGFSDHHHKAPNYSQVLCTQHQCLLGHLPHGSSVIVCPAVKILFFLSSSFFLAS